MPKLSIIIPTRDRADTLVHTLRTIVGQDYQACEILVSDNASIDNTREVVGSFSDARIRYVNTGERVSMSGNWEFALRHAQGKFVTYIGDDDGFIPGAIGRAMDLLDSSSLSALVWDKAQYSWPDHIDESARNTLYFRPRNAAVRVVNGKKKLKQVLRFREMYERLPCLYNGIVLKALITKTAESSTNGVFFNSIAPDVFSGIALSVGIGTYLLSEYPFSVNGASRHSNGTSIMSLQGTALDSPATKFLKENSREYDSRLMMTPALPTYIMGEYLLAKQYLPSFDFPEPHWDSYVRMLIRTARSSKRSAEILQSASHTVKVLGMRIRVPDRVEVSPARRNTGMHGDTFFVTPPAAMASNIYDACQLMAGLLPKDIEGVVSMSRSSFVRKLLARSVAHIGSYLLSEAKTAYRSL